MNESKASNEYKYVLIQEKKTARGKPICIISGQWVLEEEKIFYWPNGKSETAALEMAVDEEKYDPKTWDKYDYDKILFKTDSLGEAKKKEIEELNSFDSPSASETDTPLTSGSRKNNAGVSCEVKLPLQPPRRNASLRKRNLDVSTDDKSRKSKECAVLLHNCSTPKRQLNFDESTIPIESNNSSQSFPRSTPSPPLILKKNSLVNPGPSSAFSKSSDADEVDAVNPEKATLKDIYRLLQKVMKENRQLRKKCGVIHNDINELKNKTNIQTPIENINSTDFVFNIPARTVEELEQLDRELQIRENSVRFINLMKNFRPKDEACTPEEKLRQFLRIVYHKELTQYVSWKDGNEQYNAKPLKQYESAKEILRFVSIQWFHGLQSSAKDTFRKWLNNQNSTRKRYPEEAGNQNKKSKKNS